MRQNMVWLLLSLAFSGCMTTSLQNLEVAAPPARHAIRITENQAQSKVTVRSYLSSNEEESFHTRIDSNSPMPDNRATDDNLLWHISDLQGGVDFEVTLSEKAVLTAGLSHSKLQGETRWSPSVGIGFYGEGTTFGQRVDLVLKGTTSSYDAEVSESEFLSSRSLTENGKKTYGNLAVIYSLNTRRPDFPVNLFANAAIGGQTLYRHEDFSAMQLYISLSGGLFKTIGKNARLVIGGRITNFEDEGKSDDLVVPDAFVQLDFILN